MCNRRTAAKKSEGEASTLVHAKPFVNFRTLTAFPMLHGARGFFHQSLYFPQGRHAMRLIIIDSRAKSRKIMHRSWMANPTRTPTRRPGREVIGARRLAYACLAPELPSIRVVQVVQVCAAFLQSFPHRNASESPASGCKMRINFRCTTPLTHE